MSLGVLAVSLLLTQGAAETVSVEQLYEQKRYFELRDSVADSPIETRAFFQSIVAAKFNRPAEAMELGQEYLQTKHTLHRQDALELIANSAFRSFQYREAADTIQAVLDEFGDKIASKKKDDLLNFQSICRAVEQVPQQRVSKQGHTKLQNLEKSGLKVNVTAGAEALPLLFDTGANISVLRKGIADKLGVRMLPSAIKVGTMTGNTVNAQMGVLPEIRIGQITVENPIFLVMSDKDLTVGPDFMLRFDWVSRDRGSWRAEDA